MIKLATSCAWLEELDRIEYLLANGLWDNEEHRQQLRERQCQLLDEMEVAGS